MEPEKNIKGVNRKYLVAYMLLNCMILLLLSGSLAGGFQEMESIYKETRSLLGLLLFPLSVILEGLLPSEFKHRLVFWRVRNPLPGCRVFTEIAPKDPRIDMNRLNSLFSNDIPQDPASQNRAWYGIYKKYSSRRRVFDAHKAFLLTRDLVALSFISIPLSTAAYAIWGIPANKMAIHLGFLILVLLLGSRACRNYGERFAANVVLEAIHAGEGIPKAQRG